MELQLCQGGVAGKKQTVTENLHDYLLGSRFTGLTDKNPLAYVKESKLGAAQIHWLSELALSNFDIKFQSGKINLAADAFSHCPHNPKSESEEGNEDDEYETISYSMVCKFPGRRNIRI